MTEGRQNTRFFMQKLCSAPVWQLYCNDKLIGTLDTSEKATQWLSKMEATDTAQEFTWSVTRVDGELTAVPKEER